MEERDGVTRGKRARITCAADEKNLTLSVSKEDKYLICVSWEVILLLLLLLLWKQRS